MDENKLLCPHCIYEQNNEECPSGWDGKSCPNFINNQPVKVCQFYAVGKSNKQLLAYDEYDSWGSGRYYTDDVYMCDRFTMTEAKKAAKKYKLEIFLVTITKSEKGRKIEIAGFTILDDERYVLIDTGVVERIPAKPVEWHRVGDGKRFIKRKKKL